MKNEERKMKEDIKDLIRAYNNSYNIAEKEVLELRIYKMVQDMVEEKFPNEHKIIHRALEYEDLLCLQRGIFALGYRSAIRDLNLN